MRASRNSIARTGAVLIFAAVLPCTSFAQNEEQKHHEMVERGDAAMGFDAARTTHHFLLSESGGSIEASANDPTDVASRDAIRHHMAHIAQKFKAGEFDIPMFVHDQVPPGVPAMKRLKSAISYKYSATSSGARVTISTKNHEALAAIHDFLRFQIEEHQTGDPTEVPRNPSS
ncbi:MAG TPA: hypothetical protein VEG64_15730 [Candidatus Sulfotelmatobacter sp.]|nr:hypothetical protein [Candidatus Sulfotelmatobacter sp.]